LTDLAAEVEKDGNPTDGRTEVRRRDVSESGLAPWWHHDVMEISEALAFAGSNRRSVLVTQRGDGRPQLSNVMHTLDDDGVVRISTTADRAKYANLRRTPWAALHVTSQDFWSYAVLEGPVEVTDPAAAVDDPVVEELVAYYRAANGEHDDWDDYRAAMVRDRRAVVRLRPDHAYGALGDG
jgi:PPOX class probable F420-dependent enzyme